jgi:hypothetical protein
MIVRTKIPIALMAGMFFAGATAAQHGLDDEVARYQHESDPVHKARLLAKMGDEQVDLARRQLREGKDEDSLHTLELYRDEVHDTVKALNGLGVDAERKPAGFKELQISLRETIRRVDELIFSLEVDKRQFFRPVRNDLFMDQNVLIDELFPRRPDHGAAKPEG